jgi:hypothetical protein
MSADDRALAAELIAFQQQLEARRAGREVLPDFSVMPLVEEDAEKSRAAVEVAWLEHGATS